MKFPRVSAIRQHPGRANSICFPIRFHKESMTCTGINVAELFHENTKVAPFENGDDIRSLPGPLEPGLSLARISLPKVAPLAGVDLEHAIVSRMTWRAFNPAAL